MRFGASNSTRTLAGIVFFGGIMLALASCSAPLGGPSAPGTITATAAYSAATQGDAILIDVREADEIERGAPEATAARIAYRLDRSRDAKFVDETLMTVASDRTTRIILMCASGVRSAAARDLLLTQGFTDVESLDGGFRSWQASRLPTTPPVSSRH
jgi:thiosulfate sulfurtransferase